MPGSSFGKLFRLTTFGESHGAALGVIVEGVPPGMELDATEIQYELDRRRPGARGGDPKKGLVTPRAEQDAVEILSGVFEGRTLGTPIAMLVRNQDVDSSKYEKIKGKFRGSHADWVWLLKNEFYDWRGGGRSSARETVARVAAGAIAKKVLARYGITAFAHVTQIGKVKAKKFDVKQIELSAALHGIWCADGDAAAKMAETVRTAMTAGDSVGAVIEVRAQGVPAGLGEPCFEKLDAALAAAMMSLPAVKGVEIGGGFALAGMKGSQAVDELSLRDGIIVSKPNHAGGILGGISTGNEIVVRFVVKPTSSIRIPKATVQLDWAAYERGEELEFTDRDADGNRLTMITEGRHDPCVGIRAVPIAEAMMACTLLDFLLQQDVTEAWKSGRELRRDEVAARRNVLLIGTRSVGKSSIGRLLAERLGLTFVEMDEVLSEQLRREGFGSINELVAAKGWKAFRQRERVLLKRLGRRRNRVIACGGGVGGNAQSMTLAQSVGVVVWLDAPMAKLIDRRAADPGEAKRPALLRELEALKRSDLRGYLAIEVPSVFARRRPFYQQADVRLENLAAPAEVAASLADKLQRWGFAR